MARTPRTFSRRGRSEAKAGENIEQGKPREDVNVRLSRYFFAHRFPSGFFPWLPARARARARFKSADKSAFSVAM